VIIGKVRDFGEFSLEPRVQIELAHLVDGYRSYDALLDSGFNGCIALPRKLAEELRSIPGATYTLVDAEGDEIEQEAIVGYMRFHGLERHVDVHIMDGPFPDILLGLEVLKGYQVCMEIVDNGQITIELISS